MTIDPRLVSIAIANLPDLISWLRVEFMKKNPTAPTPTDAEVLAAYNEARLSSLEKDARWLEAHPKSSSEKSSEK